LGPELYGLLVYGQSWYMAFLPLAALGLDGILSREVGAKDSQQGIELVGKIVSLKIIAVPLVGLICAIIGSIADPDSALILWVFSLALIARGFANITEQIFTAYEVSRHSLNQEILFRPLEILVGLLILSAGGGILAIAAWHAGVWFLQAVRGVLLTRRYLFSFPISWKWKDSTSILKEGFLLLIGAMAYTWMLQGPLILYRHLASDQASLGSIALVFQAFFILCIFPWSISRAALPVLGRSVMHRDGNEKLFSKVMIQFTFILGGLSGILGMGIGSWLIDLVMGPAYLTTGTYLGWGLWLLLPFSVGTALQIIFVAEKRPLCVSGASIVGVIIVSVLVFAFVPAFGIKGIFLGTGIGMAIWAGLLAVLFERSKRPAILRTLFLCGLVLSVTLVTGIVAAAAQLSEWFYIPLECSLLVGGICLVGLSQKDQRHFLVNMLNRRRNF